MRSKRFARIGLAVALGAGLLVAAALLVLPRAVQAAGPPWYARGDFNGWGTTDQMYDDGTHGDVTASDGIYSAVVTPTTANRYEWKVDDGNWTESYPSSNAWLVTTQADQPVLLTFDTNTYTDGWAPGNKIVNALDSNHTWVAVGDWQGWDNANPATAMSLVGGYYELTTHIATTGTHEYKAVLTGSWDALGPDGGGNSGGRSVNAGTVSFTTTYPNQPVAFRADPATARIRAYVLEAVVINEFAAKGTEWVELYNTTANTITLNGWYVDDADCGAGASTIGAVDLGPGDYFVINADDPGDNFGLSNSGDVVVLCDDSDMEIDRVAYGNVGGAPIGPSAFGASQYSTARVVDGQDSGDDALDWNMALTPTQGIANNVPGNNLGGSVLINEVDLFPATGNDKLELYNPTAQLITVTGWYLSDGDDVAVLSGTLVVPAGGFLLLEETVDWISEGSTGVDFTSSDVAYLFDDNRVRLDQIGFNGHFFNDTAQRIPDGAGPNDGYDWTSSGGDVTWFDLPETLGYTNIRSLNISKEGPAAVLQGEVAFFTITYGNMAGDTAQSVVITEVLPAGVDYGGFITYTTDLTLISPAPPAWDAVAVLSNTTGLTFTVWATFTGPFSDQQTVDNVVWIDSPTAGFDPVSGTLSIVVLTGTTSIHDIQYVDDPVSDDASPYKDQVVCVEGVVVAGTDEIGYADANLVIEDPAGGPWSGLMVYNGGAFPDVFEGDYVRLMGEVQEYYGMTELNIRYAPNAQQVISTGNSLPAPEVITTGIFINAGTAEQWESVLIEFQDATVTELDPDAWTAMSLDDGSGATYGNNFGASDGNLTYTPQLNDTFNFIRGIGWYGRNNYKLEPRYNADISLQVAGPAIAKDAPVLVAPGELFTYTITVENQLGYTLNDVVITDVVPANATFAYALDGGGESGGIVSWTIASLPHLGSATVRFAVTATASITTITNADYAVVASNFVTPTAGVPVATVVDTRLAIHHIQGASHVSPLADRDVQDVHGIVTAKRWNGFYMQDPNPDSDVATSEAIFVYTGSAVDVGDEVLVSGAVAEFRYKAEHLSMTRIEEPTVVVSSTGNPLPAATVIGTGGHIPPQQVIDDDATGDVETSGTFDPTTDGIDFYESLEAMLVQVNDAIVVGPTSYGVIPVVGDNGANAGLLTPRGGIVIQADDFNPERILVDDAIVSSEPSVNVGASFTGPITGVIDYNDYDGNFNLLNVNTLPGTSGGVVSETTTAPITDQLRVASFNVYNLDPGDSTERFAELAGQIVDNLQAPDIIGLQEIQDNSGETNDGVVDATATYTTLIAAIQDAGGPIYEFRDISPEDGKDGGAPGGNIRVGFLFRTDRGLTFVDRPGGVATSTTTVTMGVSGVELSFSPGRIDPTSTAFNDSRKPLVGEFIFDGRKMFVVVNHFNSKGGDDALFGHTQPPVLYSEVQRLQQAQVVNDFVDSILALDPNANVIVMGDLNDFQFSTPVSDTLAADVLTNLVSTLPITEQYTYLYVGNSQVLDHVLVSDNLFQDASIEFDIVHVNAEFAYSSRRPSDHDPVVATFFIEPNLSIVKEVTPTDDLPPGGVVTYTITLSNSGDGIATSVVMTDKLPIEVDFGGWVQQSNALQSNNTITWTGGVAAATQEMIVFTATVGTDTALYGQTVTNTARFVSTNAGSSSDEATFTIVGPPVLSIAKSVALTHDPARRGDPITYTIVVRNIGPADAVGVHIADTLPSEVIGANVDVTCTVATGDAVTITVPVTVADDAPWGGVVTNTAYYEHSTGSGFDEATFTIVGPPVLSIAKSVALTHDPARRGDPITYTIVVRNTGPADAVDVHITDTLPSEVIGANVDMTRTVAAGDAVTITVPVTVASDAPWGGVVTNTAYYEHSTGSGFDEATFTIVGPPVLSIAKSVALTHDPARRGDPITYTIVVRNIGPADAVGVHITDTLPSEVIGANVDVTCTVATGDAVTITVPVTVASDAPWGGVVTNTAYYEHSTGSGSADAVFTIQQCYFIYLPLVARNG